MLRGVSLVAQSESDIPAPRRHTLAGWGIAMGCGLMIVGWTATSLHARATALSRLGQTVARAVPHLPRALGTPTRVANLTPSVIFADASTLSYRTGAIDDTPETQAARNSLRTPLGELGAMVTAAVGACLADDSDRSGRDATITWFFAADSGAPRGSAEYVLWRQRNDSTPVALVRHVLRDGRHPFLDYQYVVPSGNGADSIAIVPRAMLPISRADTVATQVDVRSLRAVEWHFLVMLDPSAQPEHMARVHVITSLPAIDRLDRHECRAHSPNHPLLTAGAAPRQPVTLQVRG